MIALRSFFRTVFANESRNFKSLCFSCHLQGVLWMLTFLHLSVKQWRGCQCFWVRSALCEGRLHGFVPLGSGGHKGVLKRKKLPKMKTFGGLWMINGLEKKERGEELTSNQWLSEIPKAPGVWIMKNYSVPEPQTPQVFPVISSRSTFFSPRAGSRPPCEHTVTPAHIIPLWKIATNLAESSPDLAAMWGV